jgi:hypothetical protein
MLYAKVKEHNICSLKYPKNKIDSYIHSFIHFFDLQLSYDQAYFGCCKYGLELVSVETLEEYNCLSQQFPSLPAYYLKFSRT